MKTHNLFPVLISASLMTSFSGAVLLSCGHTGVEGHVYVVRGNQMPSPSPDQAPAEPKGIKTTLYIFGLTNINEVTRQGNSAFYHDVSTTLIREVETDEGGYFKAKLKPGHYSLFVKKGSLYYSSQFDEKNNIHPVVVKRGKTTDVAFKVNYDAVY